MVTGRGILSGAIVIGALATLVVAVFLCIVLGLGALLGVDAVGRAWLEIGVTALVAVSFEPTRRRIRRLANRLVYGRSAEPYEVLARFTQWGASSNPVALEQVVRSLADGTTAVGASVWVARDGALTLAAAWPVGDEGRARPALEPRSVMEADLMRPIVHDGELLGALTLTAPGGLDLLPSDARLLEQVAAGLGLALRNARLRQELSREIEELRRSRQRIVGVQAETRRRLEQDLHDGVQQRLVAVRLKLGLARLRNRSASLGPLIDSLAREVDEAIDAVRQVAHGIYPPSLEARADPATSDPGPGSEGAQLADAADRTDAPGASGLARPSPGGASMQDAVLSRAARSGP